MGAVKDVNDENDGAPAGQGEDAPGLRETKKHLTRTAMHRAAVELVAEHGFAAVTVEMIAKQAGVSTRTFFNHWATKDAAVLGILPGEAHKAAVSLQEHLEHEPPEDALRRVLRESLADIPFDKDLRELKKQAMAKEPRLHSISTGNLLEVQTEMVGVLTTGYEGEDAAARATIAVQVGFALTRSAFSISMGRGIALVDAFDLAVELFDEARGA